MSARTDEFRVQPRRPKRDKYFALLRYVGRGSACIELRPIDTGQRKNRWNWWMRFNTSRLWRGPFRTKLDALLHASWACGRSGAEMQWCPLLPKEKSE